MRNIDLKIEKKISAVDTDQYESVCAINVIKKFKNMRCWYRPVWVCMRDVDFKIEKKISAVDTDQYESVCAM